MYNLPACRGCLKVNCKLHKLSDANRKLYATLTGLVPTLDLKFPSQFCTECLMHVKKAKAFRARARRAHFVLTEINTLRKKVSYSDILSVDRKITNLKTSLDYSDGKNNVCGEIEYPSEENVDHNKTSDKIEIFQAEIIQKPTEKKSRIENKESETIIVQKLIDIKSENAPDIDVDNEPLDVADDVNDEEEQKETLDIDLEDVFKDLEDVDAQDTDFEWEETRPEHNNLWFRPKCVEASDNKEIEPDAKREKEINRLKKLCAKSPAVVYESLKAVLNSTIDVLSEAEQKDALYRRTLIEPFKSALFKCMICIKVFANMEDLKQHALDHNKGFILMTHKCNICKQKFDSIPFLEMHMAEQHLYKYTCKTCSTVSYSLDELLAHQSTHDNQKQSKIPLDRYFKRINLSQAAMYHTLGIETKDPKHRFMCKPCKISFKTGDYRLHVKRHLESNRGLKCDICNLNMPTKKEMEKHMQEWHLYGYACKKCSDVMRNAMQAKLHLLNGHNKKLPPHEYKCVYCPKNFPSLQQLTVHFRHIHKSEEPHFCYNCGLHYMSFPAFFVHQLTSHCYFQLNHPSIGGDRYWCEQCSARFSCANALETHKINIGHPDAFENTQMRCSCGFGTRHPKTLRTHIMTAECGGARIVRGCQFCPAQFLDQKALVAHHKVEHPNKNFVVDNMKLCDLCGQSVHHTALHKHKKKHAQENKCYYCGKDCRHTTQLVRHILVYHSSHPYVCAICDLKFPARNECKDHILKQHQPIKFKCDFCDATFVHGIDTKRHCREVHNTVPDKFKKHFSTCVYVYPHMKLDVSLVPKETLAKEFLLKMYPYYGTEGVFIVKDHTNYLITERNSENQLVRNSPAEMATVKFGQKKLYREKRKNRNSGEGSVLENQQEERIDQPQIKKVFSTSSSRGLGAAMPKVKKKSSYELVKMDTEEQIDYFETGDIVTEEVVEEEVVEEVVQATSLSEYEVLEQNPENNSLDDLIKTEETESFGGDKYTHENYVHTSSNASFDRDKYTHENNVHTISNANNLNSEPKDEKENILEVDSSELVEKDGEYYVCIEGELYKVEEE